MSTEMFHACSNVYACNRSKSWLIMFLIMRLDLIQFGLNQVLIKSWPVYDLSAGLDAIMPK